MNSPQDTLLGDGQSLHDLVRRLFPICRSLTGNGVRQTLSILAEWVPDLKVVEVPSGTQAFDWTVPDEWNIRSAALTAPTGEIVADLAQNNLHVVGYSMPVDERMPLEALQDHLYSIPELPDAIPYVTSYYKRRWGFCLPHRVRAALPPGIYHARIDATLAPGHLTYGECVLPGGSDREVLLSTYICHPSMANNELSGPAIAAGLARWIASVPRRYTYRILFLPETIGSITYLSRHLDALKRDVMAGFVLTCMGDEGRFSYLPSRLGNNFADRIALHVLGREAPEFKRYNYRDRGSDERQYCSPGVDLPVCSIMRSKHGAYPQYHTSLDDLSFVTPRGLGETLRVMKACLETIELNCVPRATVLCEPQLGKRGLYPNLSKGGTLDSMGRRLADMMDLFAYSDGAHDLIAIAERTGSSVRALHEIATDLERAGLLRLEADATAG